MPHDSQADKDFMAQICQYAARKAVNGVYLAQLYSKSLGAPVVLVVAIGEQALEVEKIIMKAQVHKGVIQIPDGNTF